MPRPDREIDLMINTHPHADHVTGLVEVIEYFGVGEVWVSGQEYGTRIFGEFEEVSDSLDRIVAAGEVYDLGGGAVMEVLWPVGSMDGGYLDDPNDGSLVVMLRDGDVDVLLTGDIGVEEEFAILDVVYDVDVLKVGHQGSATSSGMEFLEKVMPEVAVITVGKNDYGHPHGGVLDRLDAIGAEILRTDLDGDVRVVSDGASIEVKVFDL